MLLSGVLSALLVLAGGTRAVAGYVLGSWHQRRAIEAERYGEVLLERTVDLLDEPARVATSAELSAREPLTKTSSIASRSLNRAALPPGSSRRPRPPRPAGAAATSASAAGSRGSRASSRWLPEADPAGLQRPRVRICASRCAMPSWSRARASAVAALASRVLMRCPSASISGMESRSGTDRGTRRAREQDDAPLDFRDALEMEGRISCSEPAGCARRAGQRAPRLVEAADGRAARPHRIAESVRQLNRAVGRRAPRRSTSARRRRARNSTPKMTGTATRGATSWRQASATSEATPERSTIVRGCPRPASPRARSPCRVRPSGGSGRQRSHASHLLAIHDNLHLGAGHPKVRSNRSRGKRRITRGGRS